MRGYHFQTCIFLLITLPVTIKAILHPESPCPTVFNYEGREPEFDRWYGEVQLVSNDNLVGVVLNINFDRATHLLVVRHVTYFTKENEVLINPNFWPSAQTESSLRFQNQLKFLSNYHNRS